MSSRSTASVLAIATIALTLAAAGCSSVESPTSAAPTSAAPVSSAAPGAPVCPVAYTGPNPSREQVEADISALAVEQNAIVDTYRTSFGDRAPAPAPTTGAVTDQQAAVLDAAPAGGLEKLSGVFCSTPALVAGMVDRVGAAVAAVVPDGTPDADRIRAEISSVTTRHPMSLLLGPTFDICAASVVNSALTRETNPLANDPGAIVIVSSFCPKAAGLFAPPA